MNVFASAARATNSTEVQSYAPWRNNLLTTDELRALQQLRPWLPVAHTLLLWTQVIALWTCVGLYPAWWTVVLAMPLIGTRYYALYIIGHDGLHRRLFPTRTTNDRWNDIFILGAIGAITRLNRHNHMRHHQSLALLPDPDRFKYEHANKANAIAFLLGLTGLPYVLQAARNVFSGARESRGAGTNKERYSPRDIAILAGWQLGLFVGLTWAVGWWAYFALWWIPVYCFTFVADVTRVFAEHAKLAPDADADATQRLVSYESSWLERQLFAPMNMNFHAAHHLWPAVPYYNLPHADRLMRERTPAGQGIEWRGSYAKFLLRAFAAITRAPTQRKATSDA